jgi:hypothetical protein
MRRVQRNASTASLCCADSNGPSRSAFTPTSPPHGESASRRRSPSPHSPARFVPFEFGVEPQRSMPQMCRGTDEQDDVQRLGAYCRNRASRCRRRAREQRTAEQAVDRIRGRRIHRLPDRPSRVPARSPDLAAIRRQRKEVPSRRHPRLDPSRITNPSFVTERRTRMAVRKICRQKRVPGEPSLQPPLVARCDARGQAVAHARRRVRDRAGRH